MSEMEHHKGELRLIDWLGKSLSFKEKLEVLEQSYDLDDFDPKDTWSSKDIVWFKGEFYSIEEENIDPDGDIITATKLNDTVIQFETRFYNGGACFGECIEQALGRMKC